MWTGVASKKQGFVRLSSCLCLFYGTHLLFLDGKRGLDFIQTLDWIMLSLPRNNNIMVMEILVVAGVKFYFDRK